MPEDLKLLQIDGLFSAATSIQGTSLSQSKKTLSNYHCLLFPEIIYFVQIRLLTIVIISMLCW